MKLWRCGINYTSYRFGPKGAIQGYLVHLGEEVFSVLLEG